jgi:putative flippase GtrA
VVRNILQKKSTRYLLAGVWNTLFGYGVGVGLYITLSSQLHVTVIATISNVIAISMSFLTYKLFVFKTTGNWLLEYGRSYLVYGSMALLSVALLWILVDYLEVDIYSAQALIIVITVGTSYLGHKFITFRSN